MKVSSEKRKPADNMAIIKASKVAKGGKQLLAEGSEHEVSLFNAKVLEKAGRAEIVKTFYKA